MLECSFLAELKFYFVLKTDWIPNRTFSHLRFLRIALRDVVVVFILNIFRNPFILLILDVQSSMQCSNFLSKIIKTLLLKYIFFWKLLMIRNTMLSLVLHWSRMPCPSFAKCTWAASQQNMRIENYVYIDLFKTMWSYYTRNQRPTEHTNLTTKCLYRFHFLYSLKYLPKSL